jgi:hypothetical protein
MHLDAQSRAFCAFAISDKKKTLVRFAHLIVLSFSTELEGKGSVKKNLVEFASEFAVDLIDLIEQNRRNSELFRGFLRLKIG